MTSKRDRRGFLKATFAVPLFITAALLTLWPLGTSSEPRDHADTLFNTWLVNWNTYALLHGENPLQQPIFAGFEDGQGRNDLLLTQSILAIPLHLAGMEPVRIHNLLLVFFLALAGYAAALLAVQCGSGTSGAVFTGTAVVLLPWFQSHLWHLQLFSGGLGLLALFFAMRTSDGKSGGWQIGVFVLLQCLASLYIWFFVNMALLLFLPFSGKKGAVKTAGWAATGNLACLPFILPHFSNAGHWPVDTITSVDAAAFLAPWENSLLMGWMRYSGVHPEAALWPGLAILAGFIWFLFKGKKDRTAWYLLVCMAVFSVLSLGPTLVIFGKELAPAPFRLIADLPGVSSIRLPARGSFFALAAMAILAGKQIGRKPLLAAGGMLLAAAGVLHTPVETLPLPEQPWHDWIAGNDFSRVLYLPMSYDMTRPETETLRLAGSISHFTPSVNGYSTTLPERYMNTCCVMNGWPSDQARELVDRMEVDCIIVRGWVPYGADEIFSDGHRPVSAVIP